VWWDLVKLTETAEDAKPVRLATVFHRPRNTAGPAASVEEFCRLVESNAGLRANLVCLPEGITVVGTGKSYAEVAESIPGPTTRRLGELAAKLRTHVVAGVYERIGAVVFNTSVLVGPAGEMLGIYRKTHLPQEEVEAGLTPGDYFPVFDTAIGRVGMMICWDVQFPEVARRLALNGAEILALPIWGGSEVLARARAIENHAYLVSATYDMRSFIVDPAGQVLAEATAAKPIVAAEVRPGENIYQPWLGDMRWRTWRERRGDLSNR
jgi:predicted amidohydrolase